MNGNSNNDKMISFTAEEIKYIQNLIRLDIGDCGTYLERADGDWIKGYVRLQKDEQKSLMGRIRMGKSIMGKMGVK